MQVFPDSTKEHSKLDFSLLCGYKCKDFINALYQQNMILTYYHPF